MPASHCTARLGALLQVAGFVFYVMCETINKHQFVLNFVVCIVLLAMDFWTVRATCSSHVFAAQHVSRAEPGCAGRQDAPLAHLQQPWSSV